MNVDSTDRRALLEGAFDEYQRYERYLAMAYAVGFVAFAMLLLPGAPWAAPLALLVVVAGTFRRYHVVIHRFVGVPSPATDQAVQLWGTMAQACVWGAVPIVFALAVLQAYGA